MFQRASGAGGDCTARAGIGSIAEISGAYATPGPPGAVIRRSRTTGPVAQVPPCYFLCAQKVTKKAPAPQGLDPLRFTGVFRTRSANEELLCPVNKSFLRGSDLVVWLSSNSACRPLKGREPATGALRTSAPQKRTDVPQQGVPLGPVGRRRRAADEG